MRSTLAAIGAFTFLSATAHAQSDFISDYNSAYSSSNTTVNEKIIYDDDIPYEESPLEQVLSKFYVQAFGTYAMPGEVDATYQGFSLSENMQFDDALGGGLAVGLRLGQFRTELEISGQQTSYSNKIENSAYILNEELDLTNVNVFLNGYYDLPIHENISIYLGGGIGVSFYKCEEAGSLTDKIGGTVTAGSDVSQDIGLGYHFDAGVNVILSEHIEAFTGYRLFTSSPLNFEEVEYDSPLFSTLLMGVRYNF